MGMGLLWGWDGDGVTMGLWLLLLRCKRNWGDIDISCCVSVKAHDYYHRSIFLAMVLGFLVCCSDQGPVPLNSSYVFMFVQCHAPLLLPPCCHSCVYWILAAKRKVCIRTGGLWETTPRIWYIWRHRGCPALLQEGSGLAEAPGRGSRKDWRFQCRGRCIWLGANPVPS